jgi:hypothetical protein
MKALSRRAALDSQEPTIAPRRRGAIYERDSHAEIGRVALESATKPLRLELLLAGARADLLLQLL